MSRFPTAPRAGRRLAPGALAFSFTALAGLAQAQAQALTGAADAVPATRNAPIERSTTFRQLGIDYEMTLRGAQASAGVPFGVRNDEIVEAATLHLRYRYSPELIPGSSQIKVSVNGIDVATLPVLKDKGGKLLATDVTINPRLITAYNRINLQLAGHYAQGCEDPDNAGLWANIDQASTLSMDVTPVALVDDLALLPVPFFDAHDTRRLELPFVLPHHTDLDTLQAAGIVSSWFGMLAGYRGATFPVSTTRVPKTGNAVVLASPGALPDGLEASALGLAGVTGPALAVVANPNDPNGKLLLVLGRDAAELQRAATALALREAVSGAVARLGTVSEPAPRKPYDAPHWVASDRPVRFGELVEDPRSLSVSGYHPDLVRVGLQLPPDLFIWKADGIPVNLKYRYDVPKADRASALNISINDAFVSTLPLNDRSSRLWPPGRWFARDADGARAPVERRMELPTGPFSASSQLRFHFLFDRPNAADCTRVYPNVSGSVDADSSIDLSRFDHYMAMPNLAAFGNAGYPFTRMADLSQSTIVLPANAGDADFGNVLTLLGRFGASTGYPALRVQLSTPESVERHADSDLLVLGSAKSQPLFAKWYDRMPIAQDAARGRFGALDPLLAKLPSFLSVDEKRTDLASTDEVTLHRQPDDVLLMGFQSPLAAGRSVVAFMAEDASGMQRMFDAWFDPALLKEFQGSLVLLQGKQVRSLTSGQTYYVGHLPLPTWLRWYFANHPVFLALGVVLLCLLLALAARVLLRIHAAHRLREGRHR